jgi:hypothetical protein
VRRFHVVPGHDLRDGMPWYGLLRLLLLHFDA